MAIDPPFDFDSTLPAMIRGRTVFGRYVLDRIVGRGGMGVVWLARDEKLDLPVALKFLPDAVRSDPDALRDLRRETKRALQLTHANIVRVHTFEEDAVSAAIVMEYIEGQSLAAWKAAQPCGFIEIAALAPLVRQLCGALAYAHGTAGIVHRDLKPGNLLLAKDGTLKVTDFGIARSLAETQLRLTGRASETGGTMLYMSPQQMMGEKANRADDIYALGATLFELLTGKPPFYVGDVFMQVREKIPPTVAGRRAELDATGDPVPAAWERVIAACLAKSPAKRPASAEEVAARLAEDAAVGDDEMSGQELGEREQPKVAGEEVRRDPEMGVPVPVGRAADPVVAEKRRAMKPLWLSLAALAVLGVGALYYSLVLVPQEKAQENALASNAKILVDLDRAETELARLYADAGASPNEKTTAGKDALKAKMESEVTGYLAAAPEPYQEVVRNRWERWQADAALREKLATNLAALYRSTQDAFNQVGPMLGELRTSVTKLEEAAKKPVALSSTAKSSQPVVAAPGEYVIKGGDSGAKIARDHNVSLTDLMAVNPGVNWTQIKVGQKIRLPAK